MVPRGSGCGPTEVLLFCSPSPSHYGEMDLVVVVNVAVEPGECSPIVDFGDNYGSGLNNMKSGGRGGSKLGGINNGMVEGNKDHTRARWASVDVFGTWSFWLMPKFSTANIR